MSVRAAIFDVYGTLLEVGPPPADAEERWRQLFREMFHTEPVLDRVGFSVACSQAIARRHAAARGRGIVWPEIHWPSIVAGVLPALAGLAPADQAEFLYRHIGTGHTVWMTAETAATLRWLEARQCLLGIASNAQAYTLRELGEALAGHGAGMAMFARDLCFWSFEHGFSKPDPHVFEILTTRLAARGVEPAQVVMIGDRADNDIAPARAHGWQVWRRGVGGDQEWPVFREWLMRLERA